MEKYKILEFKSKLKSLLEEYDVSIGFTCGESSDTYGLYEDCIVIQKKLKISLFRVNLFNIFYSR